MITSFTRLVMHVGKPHDTPCKRGVLTGFWVMFVQMKPTGGFGIPDTLPSTTVLKTQAGPDKLPITMTIGRKLRL